MTDVVADRVERVADDALAALSGLYGDRAASIWEQLVDLAARSHRERAVTLLDRDRRREADRGWFLDSKHIGYKAYADRFGGTLRGVADRIGHLESLGVTFLHLLSVLQPRAGENDGGYAIDDYMVPDPALGTVEDLRWLAAELGEHQINLVLDLVLNHTSDQHEWARRARDGSVYHQNLYLHFRDRELPDRFETSLPEVFPTMAPGNFTWVDDWIPISEATNGAVGTDFGSSGTGVSGASTDHPPPRGTAADTPVNGVPRVNVADRGSWLWTTFREFQWDLNWANPDVLLEMAAIALHLANLGVSVLRLDAIAFTWKRMGTDCQNQPEAHLVAQALRAVLEIAAPATLLLAEAIVGPADLVGYLGGHEFERSECHLAYHNQLMVQGWSLLASRDVRLAEIALNDLPAPPSSTNWFTYVRNHDDIGWAIDDDHAARAGLNGAAHRSFLAQFYRGEFPGSFAHGTPFSSNPLAGDERTSGMTANLVGLTAAVASGDDAEIDAALARHRFVHAIAFGWGGIPLLYMGDEFAQPDAASGAASAVDSRWLHRPWWDEALADVAQHSPRSPAGRAYRAIVELSAARRRCRPLYGGAVSNVLATDTGLFAWRRRHPRHGEMLGLANPHDHIISAESLAGLVPSAARDVLGTNGVAMWTVEPRAVRWITDAIKAPNAALSSNGVTASLG